MLKKVKKLICISLVFASCPALAGDGLPYAVRTHPYNGWNSSVRGDNRTVGMGGATAGLGDSFLASTENPSGLAMTLGGPDLNFSNNNIQDGNVQNYQNPISLNSFGLAVNHHPWGFSVGFFNSYREGQEYTLPLAGGRTALLETNISEFRIGVGRLINLQDRPLALGVALNFGTAHEAINGVGQDSSALGLIVSGMYRLPGRLLIGLSYQLPMNYPMPTSFNDTVLPGFYQPMKVPSRLVLGLGWIPNRIFRAGTSLGFIGETSNTSLLRDDQIMVGEYLTYQPRFGLAYTFADFSAVHSRVYFGSYMENTRIKGSGRIHVTLGLEARAWFMTLGYGEDASINYNNHSFSIGIDVIRLLTQLDLIPREWHPPYAGLFSDPFEPSEVDLPRPLVEKWIPRGNPLNPIEVGLALPSRVEKKLKEITDQIGSLKLRPADKEESSEKVKVTSSTRKKSKLQVGQAKEKVEE